MSLHRRASVVTSLPNVETTASRSSSLRCGRSTLTSVTTPLSPGTR